MNEQWKDVPGYEGLYQVSDLGRVRSVTHKTTDILGRTRTYKSKIMSGSSVNGYRHLVLHKGQKDTGFLVHRLVMLAFVGECPEGQQVAHGDRDKTNNKLENLRYATQKENEEDKLAHGTRAKGEASSSALLTSSEVLDVRYLWSYNFSGQKIADYFGVSCGCIYNIVYGNTWKHI